MTHLKRRAVDRAETAEHAAVTLQRLQDRVTAFAVIEVLARIGRHHLGFVMTALRTCNGALEFRHRPSTKRGGCRRAQCGKRGEGRGGGNQELGEEGNTLHTHWGIHSSDEKPPEREGLANLRRKAAKFAANVRFPPTADFRTLPGDSKRDPNFPISRPARGLGGRGSLRRREESPGSMEPRCRVTPGGPHASEGQG